MCLVPHYGSRIEWLLPRPFTRASRTWHNTAPGSSALSNMALGGASAAASRQALSAVSGQQRERSFGSKSRTLLLFVFLAHALAVTLFSSYCWCSHLSVQRWEEWLPDPRLTTTRTHRCAHTNTDTHAELGSDGTLSLSSCSECCCWAQTLGWPCWNTSPGQQQCVTGPF